MKTLKVLLQEVVSGIKAWVNSNFAQESNTVHKTGDETVNGSKTFTSASFFKAQSRPIRLLFSGDVYNSQPSSTFSTEIDFTDKNDKVMSYICFQHRSDTNETHRLCLRQQKITSDAYYSVNLNNLGEFYPEQNNQITLGSPNLFWKSIYSKDYYYNGTAWGLDKANVWSANQTISNDNAALIIKNPQMTLGVTPASSLSSALSFHDVNNTSIGYIQLKNHNNSNNVLSLVVKNKNGTDSYDCALRFRITKYGDALLYPENAPCDLGSATLSFKTLNGVNPGDLSFPDFSAEYNVSGEIVPPEGENVININGGINTFTPTVSGWLSVRMHYATSISIYRNVYSSHRVISSSPSEGDIGACSPVVAGVTYKIRILASKWDDSGNNYDHFRLAPCEGNV